MFSSDLIRKLSLMETPFYYYDLSLLYKTLTQVKTLADEYRFDIHYALKANSNKRLLNEIASYGFGADCVSGNEIKAAIDSGFSSNKVLFAGVGKTDKEIEIALEANIGMFNCESLQELLVVNDLAKKCNKIANIALRINPDVDAKTHKNITTGLNRNKFGINQSELPDIVDKLHSLSNIRVQGLHFHIGSQITDLEVFKYLCLRINDIQTWFASHDIQIDHLNVGGGLGISYVAPDDEPVADFKRYFSIFSQFLERRVDQKVHFELGRAIVAQCGSLMTKVVYTKPGDKNDFVILDAGMTELMRPALYQSYHQIDNLTAEYSQRAESQTDADYQMYTVVGPICESTDCFSEAVMLPVTKRGDLIAIRSAGAYGEVMFSNYNLRDKNQAFYQKS
jgi:diaminopimelate decarboxylase